MEIFLFIWFHFWNLLSQDVIKVHIVCVLKTQDNFSNTNKNISQRQRTAFPEKKKEKKSKS